MKKKKLKWYKGIYNKPTLWYKLPSEYIDYQDPNFWKVFNYIVERLHIKLEEAYEQIDAVNSLSQIPLEYRTKELCLLTLVSYPTTTLKYIPNEFKTEEMCIESFNANKKIINSYQKYIEKNICKKY